MQKTRKVSQALKENLKDPYFKELWELEEQKLETIKPIIDYRINNQLTQTQLAKRVGVSQQHISNIENGIFSSMATLEKVLLYIGYKVRIESIPLPKTIANRIQRHLLSKKA